MTTHAAPTVPAGSGPSGTDAAQSQGVVVTGTPLPQGDGSSDPAIGTRPPRSSGFDYAGQAVDIGPGTDGPLMVVFLAHWCPHCNAEVPVLLDWEASGDIPDGLQVVGVSTAVSADRPNFPPGQWLADKGWDWPVIADDVEQTAARAYGVTGYPFITFIAADGNVLARTSGEVPIEQLQVLADADGRDRPDQRQAGGTSMWSVTVQSSPNTTKRSKPRRNQRSWVTAITVP